MEEGAVGGTMSDSRGGSEHVTVGVVLVLRWRVLGLSAVERKRWSSSSPHTAAAPTVSCYIYRLASIHHHQKPLIDECMPQ